MTEPTIGVNISGGEQIGIIGAGAVTAGRIIINNYPARVVEPVAVGVIGPCPYPGLAYFGPNDAERFFGRDDAIKQLQAAVGRQTLTALVGASGSGKSSVVLAGLAPTLHRTGGWTFAYFRIGDDSDRDPFLALARALVPLYVASSDDTERLKNIRRLANDLRTSELSLRDVFADWRSKNKGGRILLIADQFEETFTLLPDDGVRNKFIEILLHGFPDVQSENGPDICLVLTLRADFYGHALLHRNLTNALQSHVENLGPMDRDELRSAIARPAEAVGVAFEPGLTATLLDQVEGKPGSLPLLQFALREMWWRQERGFITRRSYDEVKGVEGALAERAEKIFNDMTENGANGKIVAAFQRLFTRLVTLGDGQENTRRVVNRQELGEDVWTLAQRLAGENNRLIVTNAPPTSERETAQVIHEALIRNWPTLVDWIDRDRAFQSWLRRIANNVEIWSKDPSDEGPLLRGGQLSLAADWASARRDDFSEGELAFVNASLARRRREEEDTETARQAELRRQKALAEARRRQRWIAVAASFVFLVLAVLALREAQIAVRSQEESVNQAQVSLSRQLAAQSLNSVDSAFDLSLLLAVEASTAADTFEARSALFTSLNHHSRVATYFRGQLQPELIGARDPHGFALTLSPDGKTLAALSRTKKITTLFDVASSREIGRLASPIADFGSVAFSKDGATLVTGMDDGSVLMWDASNQRLLREFTSPSIADSNNAERANVQFAANSIAYRTFGEALTGFSAKLGAMPPRPLNVPAKADRFYLSGQNNVGVFGTGDRDTYASVWLDISTGKPIGKPKTGEIVALSPSGKLAALCKPKVIQIYDVATQKQVGPAISGDFDDGSFTAAAFSPNERLLAATVNNSKDIQLFDVNSGTSQGDVFSAHTSMIDALVFSSDGTRLFSLATDDSMIAWDVASSRSLSRAFTTGRKDWSVAVGKTLLAAANDDTTTVWNIKSGALLSSLKTADLADAHLAFSPDESLLLASGTSDTADAAVFDLATSARLIKLPDDNARSGPLAVSPSGQAVALVRDQKKIILWNRSSGAYSDAVAEAADQVTALTFVDADHLAFLDKGGHFSLCALQSGAPPCSLINGAEDIQNPEKGSLDLLIAAAPDRDLLISTSYASVYLWNWLTRRFAIAIALDDGGIIAPATVAVAPQSALVAVGGFGVGYVRIFDDRLSQTFPDKLLPDGMAKAEATSGLGFSPDGRIFAAIIDGNTFLWDFDLASWRGKACAIANRNLTQQEWDRYLGSVAYHKTCEDVR